jgi:hypothetical protein
MRLKLAQLADRKQSDPELERRIEETAAKLRKYEAPPARPEPPKGLVQLKKKTVEGTTVPAGAALSPMETTL